ncbi:MAG: endonuclease III [Planctomycetes bacterium]|nr:endonuclease III [Planctomycetota bacterium]
MVRRADPAAERRRLAAILRGLRKEHPEPRCALVHRDAFQLLVATILSAQCTDERVNLVTPGLFARWGTPEALAEVPLPLLEQEIRSTGFFRNKAKNIQGAARTLVTRFAGRVPDRMEDLLELPGVARKTANVVLGTAFGRAEGVVVDTHVARLARRLGLTRHGDPVKIERDLMERIPREDWIWFSHALIWHGRKVCAARKPACERCVLAAHCPSAVHTATRAGR